MRIPLPFAVFLLAAGCMGAPIRHPLPDAQPGMTFQDAKREAIRLLKSASLQPTGFTIVGLADGFKYRVVEDGINFSYMRYAGILDDKGSPRETSCGYDYLEATRIDERPSKMLHHRFHFELPLGRACDNLSVFFSTKENAFHFASVLRSLKELSAAGLTNPAAISKADITNIVSAAVAVAQAPRPAAPAPVSDVDKPAIRLAERPDDYALVVGIEKYSELPDASFAERDAEAVKDHIIALGFPSRNVVLLSGEKAGYKSIEKYVETWLARNVDEKSRVFFYFSGHGAPDVKSGESYLVPWDGDAAFLENTGYPLKRLYQKLGELRAAEVFVALDACFSGAGGRSVLAKGARPLVTTAALSAAPSDKLVVLAAAGSEQVTSSLDEQGHGTFTYYFLKGLSGAAKDASGAVTAEGLHSYLKPRVEDAARRQNRAQNPVILGAGRDRALVRF